MDFPINLLLMCLFTEKIKSKILLIVMLLSSFYIHQHFQKPYQL